ncbi:MAG: acireductone synthase [Acidobacteriota bacterium]|nr:acireductone synthase [Acidobacteriota bacterium]
MSEMQPRIFLCDIEGTVAPISLVSEQLFPYARKHLAQYLKENLAHPDVQKDLKLLAEENRNEEDLECPTHGMEIRNELYARTYLLWLMDQDRKSTALKSLQGKIWKAGFESGELKGELFADVPGAFARWNQSSRVAIYSSGSVDAQKLLFRYSTYGDLSPLIRGYFDTRTGAKSESASYASIAAQLAVLPRELVFFSDMVRELNAAREAGCQTRLVLRPGNAPVQDIDGHLLVESFEPSAHLFW